MTKIQEPGEFFLPGPLRADRTARFQLVSAESDLRILAQLENHTGLLGEAAIREMFWQQPKAGKLCDWQIRQRCEAWGMIEPFESRQVRRVYESDGAPAYENETPRQTVNSGDEPTRRIVSYGLSSYGYDIRPSTKWRVYYNRFRSVIDPHNLNEEQLLEDYEGDYCDIPPNGYILANTLERFDIPPNMVCDAIGKSTYARCGLIINLTPLEPAWCGHLTLELCNGTPVPIRVYANEGIAQLRFYEGPIADVTYASRQGKYQDQPDRPIAARL